MASLFSLLLTACWRAPEPDYTFRKNGTHSPLRRVVARGRIQLMLQAREDAETPVRRRCSGAAVANALPRPGARGHWHPAPLCPRRALRCAELVRQAQESGRVRRASTIQVWPAADRLP